MEAWQDPRVIAALVAAGTSLLVTITTKLILNKMFYDYQLRRNYEYEQKSKIKSTIGKYKMPIVNACESLINRFGNLWINYHKRLHYAKGDYYTESERADYLKSFVYRVLAVFGWLKILERNLIYFDTVNSQKSDLELIKFSSMFKGIICDHIMTKEVEPNYKRRKIDHIERNRFEDMINVVIDENTDGIISFSTFTTKLDENNNCIQEQLKPLFKYLENVNPKEKRNRWHILSIFQLALIAFVNTYGYDFQHIGEKKIKKYRDYVKGYKLLPAFIRLINRKKLNKQKEMNVLVNILGNKI